MEDRALEEVFPASVAAALTPAYQAAWSGECVSLALDVTEFSLKLQAQLQPVFMNGAVFETIFNVFFKLNYAKTYDGVLATPMGISEIAIGELLWALMRSALYAVAMFVLMLAMGLILSPLGILMIPAALVVAGSCVTSLTLAGSLSGRVSDASGVKSLQSAEVEIVLQALKRLLDAKP